MSELKAVGMLCDHAQVEGGKLFVSGAGISRVGSAAVEPIRVNIALAVLLTVPWHATNQGHKLTIELIYDSEEGPRQVQLMGENPGVSAEDQGKIVADFNLGRPSVMRPGSDTIVPVAIPMNGLPLPAPGGYFFSLAINGTEVDRVSFQAEPLMAGLTLR